MKVIDHQAQPREDWRQGVTTCMLVSAVNGAHQLTIFDQYCEPGLGAPSHLHAVEEVLTVIDGRAEIWVGSDASGISAAMHSGWSPPHSHVCMPPIEVPMMSRAWFTPRPSVSRRYCASIMSR